MGSSQSTSIAPAAGGAPNVCPCNCTKNQKC